MLSTDLPADRPRRVLLIEDSELDRRWLRANLASDELRILEVADGESGVRLCRETPPDLVLLDLGLAGQDGFETLRRLKDDSRTANVPVIVVSGPAAVEDKARGLDLGAVDFVTKPYELLELQARIRVALRAKRLTEVLEMRAHLDGLTGLANRVALDDRMTTEWAAHRRGGGALAVWIADLDHFKAVNDDYGHAAGDAALRQVASVLRASVRVNDLAARYGGEEFMVICPDSSLAGAVATADRFRQRLAATPIVLESGQSVRLTISVGVASTPEDAVASPTALIIKADAALYHAKALGRDRVFSRFDLTRAPSRSDGPLLTRLKRWSNGITA